ncbi:Zinc finger, GRF-type [Sesbania bispinosa]|nr:Zinc finger, GRF-type [Sesbania bispinosa]
MKASRSHPTKRASSCKSFASSSYPRCRLCKCGEELLLLISKTATNPGRVFWRCKNWDKSNSCNFFQWADEEGTQQDTKEDSSQYIDQQVEEIHRKIGKLQKKLGTERTKAIFFVSCCHVMGSDNSCLFDM